MNEALDQLTRNTASIGGGTAFWHVLYALGLSFFLSLVLAGSIARPTAGSATRCRSCTR